MTDEVQPLTWQKSTNLKEHQQFFSKINEIIDNLAPTVEEAEAATAAANAAISNANTAISNANAAIATANAASSEANTAAETVAGYNARLSTVESQYIKKIAATVQTIDSDLQIVNGHSLAVAGDVNAAGDVNGEGAELAGMAFEKNGAKTRLSNEDGVQIVGTTEVSVVDTTAGVRSLAAVNGNRVQNDLDAYPTMARTVNNQEILGIKKFHQLSQVINAGEVNSTADACFVKIGNITGRMLADVKIYIGGGYTSVCEIIEVMFNSFDADAHYFTARKRPFGTNTSVKLFVGYNTGVKGYDIWLQLPATITWVIVEGTINAFANKVDNSTFGVMELTPTTDPTDSYTDFTEVLP